MIRFSPDTWFEAVMRPLAMALPQSWIYTEIMAPDMRFAALILALAIAAVLWLQGRRWMGDNRALVILLLVVAFSFPVWLLTGGNGRYFMAILLLVGPVLVAVWHRLPLQAAKKWMLMLLFAAMQVTAIAVNPPWDPFDTFEWVRWRDTGYFHLDTRAVADDKGVTYVTLPGQTNSLVAPCFPMNQMDQPHLVRRAGFPFQPKAGGRRGSSAIECCVRFEVVAAVAASGSHTRQGAS